MPRNRAAMSLTGQRGGGSGAVRACLAASAADRPWPISSVMRRMRTSSAREYRRSRRVSGPGGAGRNAAPRHGAGPATRRCDVPARQLILTAVLGSATSIRPLQEALGPSEDGRISVEDTELPAEEYARYQADVAEESRPPFQAPDGPAAAVAAARTAGPLAPVSRGDEPVLHFVRQWTARAIAALRPGATRQARQRAAAFWRWRSPPSRKTAKTLSTNSWKPATTITPPGRTTRR